MSLGQFQYKIHYPGRDAGNLYHVVTEVLVDDEPHATLDSLASFSVSRIGGLIQGLSCPHPLFGLLINPEHATVSSLILPQEFGGSRPAAGCVRYT